MLKLTRSVWIRKGEEIKVGWVAVGPDGEVVLGTASNTRRVCWAELLNHQLSQMPKRLRKHCQKSFYNKGWRVRRLRWVVV